MNNYAEGTSPVPARGNPHAANDGERKKEQEQQQWNRFITAKDSLAGKLVAAGKPR